MRGVVETRIGKKVADAQLLEDLLTKLISFIRFKEHFDQAAEDSGARDESYKGVIPVGIRQLLRQKLKAFVFLQATDQPFAAWAALNAKYWLRAKLPASTITAILVTAHAVESYVAPPVFTQAKRAFVVCQVPEASHGSTPLPRSS